MFIYLMRHGQTNWNVEMRMQGSADIPLNETGKAQARQAAAGMAQIPFDYALSSPLSRARQTAEIVTEGRSLPLHIDTRLTELNFGIMEGAHRQDYPEASIYFHDPAHYVPLEGGESYAELDVRCAGILENLFLPLEKDYEHVLVCSHAALITGLVRRVLNRPLCDFWSGPRRGNCSCSILECKNGQFRLIEESHIFG